MTKERQDFSWNLLPWRQRQKRQYRQQSAILFLKEILKAFGFLFFAHLALLGLLHYQDEINSGFHQKIKTLQMKAGDAQQTLEEAQRFYQETTMLKMIMAQSSSPASFLSALNQVGVDDTYFTEGKMQKTELVLQGWSVTLAQFNRLINNIKHTPTLGRLETQHIQPESGNAPYQYMFMLRMTR